MYPKTIPNLTAVEFWNALAFRLKSNFIFDGDTFDRELVRDTILASRGKFSI